MSGTKRQRYTIAVRVEFAGIHARDFTYVVWASNPLEAQEMARNNASDYLNEFYKDWRIMGAREADQDA
jgi:hypothetical protein